LIVIVPLVEVKVPLDWVKEVQVIDWEPPVNVPPLMVKEVQVIDWEPPVNVPPLMVTAPNETA
jgi:hypothetical protein